MAYFKQGGNRGGGYSDRDDSRRPGFAKKSWGDDRGGGRGGVTMHKATCANCGREAEVPFRPLPGKLVYCKDCFGKREGGDDRAPRRDFRGPERPRQDFRPDNRGGDDVKRELQALNAKMDKLVQMAESMMRPKQAEKPVEVPAAKAADKSLKEIVDQAVEKPKAKAKKAPAKKKKKE